MAPTAPTLLQRLRLRKAAPAAAARNEEYAAPDGTLNVAWHTLATVDDVLARAATNTATGLTDAEVAERRAKYGANVMTTGAKRTWLMRLYDQVNNSLIVLLIIAAIVEAIFQSWSDLM
jgi:magnesium-transporting ATPase (P-type)